MAIKEYYTKQFSKSIRLIAFSRFEGILLQLAQFIFMVIFMVENIANYSYKDESLIVQIRYKNLIENEQLQYIMVYITFAINLIAILLIILDYIIYSTTTAAAATANKKQNLDDSQTYLFQKVLSLVVKTYEYLVAIPSSYFSLTLVYNPISNLNLIFTILIGCFFSVHDFSYSLSIQKRDVLSRGNYLEIYICKYVFIVVLSLTTVYFQTQFSDVLCFIYGLFLIFSFYSFKLYHDQTTRITDLFFNCFYTLSSFAFFILRYLNYFDIFIFSLFMILPFSYKIALIIENHQSDLQSMDIKFQKRKDSDNLSSPKIIYLVNLLLKNVKLNFSLYSQNESSIILEQMSYFHVENCSQIQDCFCNQKNLGADLRDGDQGVITTRDKKWENMIGEKKRKQFLENFISTLFKKGRENKMRNNRKSSSNLDFSYIHFLVEYAQSSVMSMMQLSQIQIARPYPLREQAYLGYISYLIKSSFSQVGIQQSYFGQALNFEEELTSLLLDYEDCLIQKLQMMDILNKDYINLQSFMQQTNHFQDKKEKVYKNIKIMLQISPQNLLLKEMVRGYIQDLSFIEFKKNFIKRETVYDKIFLSQKQKFSMHNYSISTQDSSDISNFQSKNSEIQQEKEQNQCKQLNVQINCSKTSPQNNGASLIKNSQLKNTKSKFKIDPLNPNCCTIFVKINGQEQGTISKAQSSFYKIFGLDQGVGSHINSIIPSQMAKYHTQLLDEYLNSNDSRQRNWKGKPLLLAQDGNGWAIPIRMGYTIGYISRGEEAGLIATIEEIQNENEYLLADNSTYKIGLCSRGVFDKLFSSSFSNPSQLSTVHLNRIIPLLLLYSHNTTQELPFNQRNPQNISHCQNVQAELINHCQLPIDHEDIITTLAFIPLSSNKLKTLNTLQKPLEFKDLSKFVQKINSSKYDIFSIKFKIHLNSNKYFNNAIIEIHKIKRFKRSKPLQDSLEQMKQQFQTLCNINFSFDDLTNNFSTLHLSPKSRSSLQDNQLQNSQMDEEKEDNKNKHVWEQSNTYLSPRFDNNLSPRLDRLLPKTDQFSPRLEPFTPTVFSNQQIFLSTQDDLIFTKNIQSNMSSRIIVSYNDKMQQDSNKINPDEQQQQQSNMMQSRNIELIENCSQIILGEDKQLKNCKTAMMQKDNRLLSFLDSDTQMGLEKRSTPPEVSYQNSISRYEDIQKVEKQSNGLKVIEQDITSNLFSQDNLRIIQINEYNNHKNTLSGSKSLETSKSKVKNMGVKKPTTKLNNNNDVSSIQSGLTYTNEAKKAFAFKILAKQKDIGLRMLNLLGFSCLVIIISLILSSYFKVYDLFQQEKQDFKNVAWPMHLRSIVSINQYYIQYIHFYDNQIFPDIQGQIWKDFYSLNQRRIQYEESSFIDLYSQFLRSDQDRFTYFKNYTDEQFTFFHHKDFNSYPRQKTLQTLSLQYFMLMLKMYAKRFTSNLHNTLNEQAMINDNFPSYSKQLSLLQTNIENSTIAVLDEIEQNVQQLMIIVIVISLLFVMAVYPAYYLAQTKLEAILKLFATFTPESLQTLIQTCKGSIQRISLIKSQNMTRFKQQIADKTHLNLQCFLNKQDFNQKKKNIAVTSQIPRVSNLLMLGSTLIYILIILQPIINSNMITSLTQESRTNLSLMSKFFKSYFFQQLTFLTQTKFCFHQIILLQLLKNFDNNLYLQNILKCNYYIKMIGTIFDLRAHFASNLYLNYAYLLEKMCDNCAFYNRDYFKGRIPVFFALNPSKLSNLYEVIQKNISYDRYKQEYYNTFFNKILQGNICEALRDHPEFKTGDAFTFNFDRCSSIRNNMLTKGFQICTKDLLDQLPPLFDILQESDRKQSQKDLTQWEQQFNILEFDEYCDYMINTITALKNFMIAMSDDYLTYVQNIQLYLLIFQILTMIFIFYFIWLKFYDYIYQSLYKTKQLLSFIDIIVIISNPYIMNYINDR